MDVVSLFNLKGGVGKSTLTPILAASIKVKFPELKVGVIATDSANGTLAKMYSKDLEAEDKGLWNIIGTMVSRRTAGRPDLLEKAILEAVRPLTVVPSRSAVASRQADFEEAARDLGVDPTAPIEQRQIEFLGTAQYLGPEFKALAALNQPNSKDTVGAPILQAIESVLGWDVCFLDLPGESEDRLVRLLAPWCTCVVIPSDVYKAANLTMEHDVVATLKELNVTPAGFLANKDAGTAASRTAKEQLESIAKLHGLEVLGVIKSLPTLATANSAFDIHGREFIPQADDWAVPEEGWFVGLHRAALDFRANESIRSAAVSALQEIDKAAEAMIRSTPNLASRRSVEV